MSGAIPPLPQYTFMAWCLVKAQGQLYLYFHLNNVLINTCSSTTKLYVLLATTMHISLGLTSPK
jgi:hypothetical protein